MSLGMMYTAQFNGVAVTAQQDLFELLAPADCAVILHLVQVTQSTEVGDAQEEGLSLLIKRGVGSTSGTGGSTPTPAKLQTGFAAAGTVVEANNTTKMTAGTITTLWADVWNVRAPFIFLPPPEVRPVLSPSERLTVELATTPGDSITMNGVIVFEELGG